jgi:hypothetical protein
VEVPRLVLGSSDGTIQLWNTTTGQQERSIHGHGHFVMGVAFSPDGSRLASASHDQTVRLWDVATGQEVLTFKGHTNGVNSVAFSPDGNWLASASNDGTVKLWDARPLTPEGVIEREALSLLDFLFAKPLCRDDVLDYLRNSPTIRPPVRQLALTLAERYREETDPERFNQAARAIVRQRYLNALQYHMALRQAETARRLNPDPAKYRTTLGMAQYRAGRLAEAQATLPPESSVPADLAFRAMAQHRLGQKEPAQATLQRLRQMLHQPEWAKQPETQTFGREAEDLLHPAGGDVPE